MSDFINLFATVFLPIFFALGAFVMGRKSRQARARAKFWFALAALSASLFFIIFFATHTIPALYRISGEGFAGVFLGTVLWAMFMEVDHEEPD